MMTMTRLALCEESPSGVHYFISSPTRCIYCTKFLEDVSRVTICARCHQPPASGLVDQGPYSTAVCQKCSRKETS